MYKDRIANVLKSMREQELSQILICDPFSVYYLTGKLVDPGERFFALYLNQNGTHLIFINELFTVPEELGVEKVWYSDVNPVMELVAERIDHSCVLGVDKDLPARF